MQRAFMRILALVIFLSLGIRTIRSQSYTIVSGYEDYECNKGSAGVNVAGLQTNDTIIYTWSTGVTGVTSISELEAGDYNVEINIKNKKDTTINFKIQKTECKVVISSHFTPNDDGYNDSWTISNTEFFPKFHLYVFDKWGQQVHKQSETYTKWNGNLGGSGIAVADGTYYYVFYYEGSTGKLVKGDVTILR